MPQPRMNVRITSRQSPPGSDPNRTSGSNGESDSSGISNQAVSLVAVVAVVFVICAAVVLYMVLRRLRAQNRKPRYLPGKFLKRRWENWQPIGKYKTVHSSERGESLTNTNTAYNRAEERSATNAAAAGVDRNTSVRSVMTLPPYSQAPKESEQVIGREGERAGMDTVVEFPETVEEQEEHRETEMASLYQIRLARRQELAEREERRQQRREARDRGDWQRLEELRREARGRSNSAVNASTGNLTADTLLAEHQSRSRERRVSSVAYGDVGQVRHDGTRVRAGSVESERGGLLDGAAPMGENLGHARTNSEAASLFTMNNLSRPSVFTSGRHRSDSGAPSVSTTASSFDTADDHVTPGTEDNRPGSNHSNSTTPIVNITPQSSRRDSADLVDQRVLSMIRESDQDVSHPPEYEQHDWGDAPAYEEQVRRAESQRLQSRQAQDTEMTPFPQLAVPSINIQLASEPSTPVVGHRRSESQRRV